MSLCPNYCECRTCKHGKLLCQECSACEETFQRDKQQLQHLQSVERQKRRLKLLRGEGKKEG